MKKFLIKVNGSQYEVEVEEVGGSVVSAPVAEVRAAAPAPVAPVTTEPAPKVAPKVSSEVPAGAFVLKAPMPGTILKVNVNVGDVVKKNQVLLILEAMKMENEIVATNAGTITSIGVSKGDSVNAGDIMVSIS